MKGGFYDISNLARCNPNHYCKDGEDNIININNTLLDELFINKITEDRKTYEDSLKQLAQQVKYRNIVDINNVYLYNQEIQKLLKKVLPQKVLPEEELAKIALASEKVLPEEELAKIALASEKVLPEEELPEKLSPEETAYKKLLNIIGKKYRIAEHGSIDELLKTDPNIMGILDKHRKEITFVSNLGKALDRLILDKQKIDKFKRKHDNSTNCINKKELEEALNSLTKYNYDQHIVKLNNHFSNHTNLNTYIDKLHCIIPFITSETNIFNNIIKRENINNNFRVYRKFNDIYYQIYEHTFPHSPSPNYINYSFDDNYVFVKIDAPIQTLNIIDKRVLYPNFYSLSSVANIESNKNELSFIIYNSPDKFQRFLFGLKLYTIGKIDIILDRYLVKNTDNLILYSKYYTLLDIFIISNVYNIYYNILTTNIKLNAIYNDEYFKQKQDEIFVQFIKDEIYKTRKINMEIINGLKGRGYDVQIKNLNDIYVQLNRDIPNKNLLISSYNYLFLMVNNIMDINIKQDTRLALFEKMNTQLKYTSEQIYMLICIDLYKEIIENNYLYNSKIYKIEEFSKIILNIIYFNTIYQQDKVKNLINYSRQFDYLKTLYYCHDIDSNFNPYKPEIIKDVVNFGTEQYQKFYFNILNSNTIKYIPYNYSNYAMNMKHYTDETNYVLHSNVSTCGEILIFNIINLFIYDDEMKDINPELLPISTIQPIQEFYNKNNMKNFTSAIIVNEFIPLLHEIPFTIIKDIKPDVYRYFYEKDGKMMRGSEILPSYINVCRILAHIFGRNIYNATGEEIICNHEILKTLLMLFDIKKGGIEEGKGGNEESKEEAKESKEEAKVNKILSKYLTEPSINDATFKSNVHLNVKLNGVSLYMASKHGEMFIDNKITPEDYIDRPICHLYNNTVVAEYNIDVFKILSNSDNDNKINLKEKLQIINSNSVYKGLFEANKILYLLNIINDDKIKEVSHLSEINDALGIFGFKDIQDMINHVLKTPTPEHLERILLVIYKMVNIFTIDLELINFEDINNIFSFKDPEIFSSLIKNTYKIFEFATTKSKEKLLPILQKKISKDFIDKFFDVIVSKYETFKTLNIYLYMPQVFVYYINSFHPKELDNYESMINQLLASETKQNMERALLYLSDVLYYPIIKLDLLNFDNLNKVFSFETPDKITNYIYRIFESGMIKTQNGSALLTKLGTIPEKKFFNNFLDNLLLYYSEINIIQFQVKFFLNFYIKKFKPYGFTNYEEIINAFLSSNDKQKIEHALLSLSDSLNDLPLNINLIEITHINDIFTMFKDSENLDTIIKYIYNIFAIAFKKQQKTLIDLLKTLNKPFIKEFFEKALLYYPMYDDMKPVKFNDGIKPINFFLTYLTIFYNTEEPASENPVMDIETIISNLLLADNPVMIEKALLFINDIFYYNVSIDIEKMTLNNINNIFKFRDSKNFFEIINNTKRIFTTVLRGNPKLLSLLKNINIETIDNFFDVMLVNYSKIDNIYISHNEFTSLYTSAFKITDLSIKIKETINKLLSEEDSYVLEESLLVVKDIIINNNFSTINDFDLSKLENIFKFKSFGNFLKIVNNTYKIFENVLSDRNSYLLKLLLNIPDKSIINKFFELFLVNYSNIEYTIYGYDDATFIYNYLLKLKPNNLDINKLCAFIVDRSTKYITIDMFVCAYLLAGNKEYKILYNKLFFENQKFKLDDMLVLIDDVFIKNIFKYENEEKNIMNESCRFLLDMFLDIFYERYNKNEKAKNKILEYQLKNLSFMTEKITSMNLYLKEFLEDDKNLCLILAIICYNNMILGKTLSANHEELITRFIKIIRERTPNFSFKGVGDIFSSRTSKQLLDSFRLKLYSNSIRYIVDGEKKSISYIEDSDAVDAHTAPIDAHTAPSGAPIDAHSAHSAPSDAPIDAHSALTALTEASDTERKYLKYKSKYLRLKQFVKR